MHYIFESVSFEKDQDFSNYSGQFEQRIQEAEAQGAVQDFRDEYEYEQTTGTGTHTVTVYRAILHYGE